LVDSARYYRDPRGVQVFLIRHAEASDETLELRDPHRDLTETGREQARALGERLRWHDCTPTEVWTSPLVRAVQTAELVLSSLGSSARVLAAPALAPGADIRPLAQRLDTLVVGTVVMLVGHEPILSGLGTILTGRTGAGEFAALARAEAVRIDGEPGARSGRYRVRWRFAWNDTAPRS
jgi:phosphohistidine phosphatase